MSAMRGDNNTVFGLARFSWDDFDRLPATLKQVLNYGFFDMGTTYVVDRLNEGDSPQDLAAELNQIDAAKARDMARQAYGPAHPQAKAAGGALQGVERSVSPPSSEGGERFSLRGLIAKQDMRQTGGR
jgi:hypothetical protein